MSKCKYKKYKIVAKDDILAVHSMGYFSKKKAQKRCDSGYCARYWDDKEQAKKGFIVVPDEP